MNVEVEFFPFKFTDLPEVSVIPKGTKDPFRHAVAFLRPGHLPLPILSPLSPRTVFLTFQREGWGREVGDRTLAGNVGFWGHSGCGQIPLGRPLPHPR